MGLSSPKSRLAEYLVAGKEFGERFNKTRFFEFVIETFETVTTRQEIESAFHFFFFFFAGKGGVKKKKRKEKKKGKRTSRLILEKQTPRIIQTTSDIAHIETKAKTKASANKEYEPKTPKANV